jgi:glyoxylase-like metal-dependent hydrolase (beta-lactamase superfamily II)
MLTKLVSRYLAALIILTGLAPFPSQASDLDYPLTPVSEKVHVIYGPFALPNVQNRGFRNNVVIVSTSEGMVVFDPGGSAAAGEMVAEKVKSITDAPIVAVFNSHGHGDHWLGNEGIKKAHPSVVIYGHPVMKSKIEGPIGEQWLTTINRLTEGTAGGKQVVAPNKPVDDGNLIRIGDTELRIHHTGPAHTDNDIMIEIVGENVLFTGDVVRNGMLGIMEDDASFKGNLVAIDFIAQKTFKLYIPGHGKAGGIEVLDGYRSYLRAVRETVKELYEQGLADYEMKPKVVEAASAFKNWNGFDLRVGPHVSRAYLEIEAEAF